ncbi:hypothetical protein KCP70_13490 [Salmonella enterica subsp. enterica]|nr:hypothetical protein KCP70_13490 [Salmonella enterica subsp. enterica]
MYPTCQAAVPYWRAKASARDPPRRLAVLGPFLFRRRAFAHIGSLNERNTFRPLSLVAAATAGEMRYRSAGSCMCVLRVVTLGNMFTCGAGPWKTARPTQFYD